MTPSPHMPADQDLSTRIGPVFDTNGVAAYLHASDTTAALLELATSDGHRVYPAFQFTDTGIDARFQPALAALATAPRWTAALWFVTPNPDLDGLTPLDWIRADKAIETVRVSARAAVADWR